ncbi:MAG TPA: GntG family PLP-dependent aldolase [Candidatus Acidoferrales bacterium]|nr:GntG family PLP-dependent aldolase [Candidatus Acidoferrales bacterium]
MPLVDLRSDTVTHPTPEMRRAMADAELGDDVFGDDPTVNALEARAAEITGMEGGLFVASGTMGNLVSLIAHVPRGGEIIAEAESHTLRDEQAGHAVIVGASARGIPARPDGTMDPALVAAAFRDPLDLHEPRTSLIVLENTHAHSMGQPLTPGYTAGIAGIAHGHGVPLHVDGARLFNAAVALGVPAAELLAPADSATFCLSKGLACPIGSVVVGAGGFIARARRARKLVGGGMRQVGVLAAAGLVALRDGPRGMIERLAEDHANARRLAEALASMPGIVGLDPARVATNFVVFGVAATDQGSAAADLAPRELRVRFLDALRAEGVLMIEYPHDTIRAVTHYGVSADDIDRVVEACGTALAACGAAPSPATPVT